MDPSSPAFEQIAQRVSLVGKTSFGSSVMEAFAQAQQFIFEFARGQIFIQSIDDCLLLAGIITFFSAIPLFFLSRK
jgi:hypothetical protein